MARVHASFEWQVVARVGMYCRDELGQRIRKQDKKVK